MQTQILRLESLATRLAERADLADDEFDFDSEPGVGGPEEPTHEPTYAPTQALPDSSATRDPEVAMYDSGRELSLDAGRLARRASLGLADNTPIAVYTGTFEHYQGLDLLYDAMVHVASREPDARLVIVGGTPAQVGKARAQVVARGIAEAVVFTGQRPAEEIPAYLDAATLLVSPRSTGTNTPLKIYQYLRSGRPIVATNLRTHTQVLSDATAVLADATPDAMADAMLRVFRDPELAQAVGGRAVAMAETEYSEAAYMAKTQRACDLLFGASAGSALREPAR
jgi:glycosyltransferase involved in cell wall biosynthesis